jgi:fatty acid/phospholipid biosynthesis enzyme
LWTTLSAGQALPHHHSGCSKSLSEIPDLFLIVVGDEERIMREFEKHPGTDLSRVEIARRRT